MDYSIFPSILSRFILFYFSIFPSPPPFHYPPFKFIFIGLSYPFENFVSILNGILNRAGKLFEGVDESRRDTERSSFARTFSRIGERVALYGRKRGKKFKLFRHAFRLFLRGKRQRRLNLHRQLIQRREIWKSRAATARKLSARGLALCIEFAYRSLLSLSLLLYIYIIYFLLRFSSSLLLPPFLPFLSSFLLSFLFSSWESLFITAYNTQYILIYSGAGGRLIRLTRGIDIRIERGLNEAYRAFGWYFRDAYHDASFVTLRAIDFSPPAAARRRRACYRVQRNYAARCIIPSMLSRPPRSATDSLARFNRGRNRSRRAHRSVRRARPRYLLRTALPKTSFENVLVLFAKLDPSRNESFFLIASRYSRRIET